MLFDGQGDTDHVGVEAVEGGGWFGGSEVLGDGDIGGFLWGTEVVDVVGEGLAVLAGGTEAVEAFLPLGELLRVGIDSLYLLCEVTEGAACGFLRVGAVALIRMFDDIGLLNAVPDAEDDFIASAECSADVGDRGDSCYFCHSCWVLRCYYDKCNMLWVSYGYPTVIVR